MILQEKNGTKEIIENKDLKSYTYRDNHGRIHNNDGPALFQEEKNGKTYAEWWDQGNKIAHCKDGVFYKSSSLSGSNEPGNEFLLIGQAEKLNPNIELINLREIKMCLSINELKNKATEKIEVIRDEVEMANRFKKNKSI